MSGSRALSSLLTSTLFFLLVPACGGGDTGTPDAGDGFPPCSLGLTMADIEEKLFKGNDCKVCHTLTATGQKPLYPTNLDLGSPGLAMRMVDQPTESDPMKGKCAGRILVPKMDPLHGVFVEKVEHPSCGDRMPQALPPLNADKISCVKRWAMLAAMSVP
jgi:hypothetical protein